MAFAISLVLRGGQAARQALVAIKEGVLGIASAEQRLAAETARAATQQDRLATAARKAHQELKAAAAALHAQSAATGVDRLTGGRTALPGREFGSAATQRVAALMALQRQARTDWAGMPEAPGRMGGMAMVRHAIAGRVGGILGSAIAPSGGGGGGAAIGAIGSMAASVGGPMLALAAGIGAAAGGLALFKAEIDAAKDSIRRIGQLAIEIKSAQREERAGADSEANATAKRLQPAMAALINAGKLDVGHQMGRELGPQGLEAAGLLQQKGLLGNAKVTEAMKMAVATGQIDPMTFARTIGESRGIAGAGSPEAIAKTVLAKQGIYGVNVAQAGAAFSGSEFGKGAARIDAAGNRIQEAGLGAVATRNTTGGMVERAVEIAAPEMAALGKMKRQLDENQAILERTVQDQGYMASFFDRLLSFRGGSEVQRRQALRESSGALEP